MQLLLVTINLAGLLALADELAGKSKTATPYASLLLVLGAVFLGVFFLIRTQRRVARSQEHSRLSAGERVAQQQKKQLDSREIRTTYEQINELMAALAELSRQINGQIDIRLAKLQLLLHDADKAVQRLQQLTGKAEGKTGPGPTAIDEAAAGAVRDLSNRIQQHSDQSARPGDSVDLAEKPVKKDARPADSQGNHRDNQTQGILELARQGLSAVTIARKLARPVGEIELILSLNDKKKP